MSERRNVAIDCGWGTLHFADTYDSGAALAAAMRAEGPGRRDIAFYVEEPHVMLSAAPLELFLDPSHAFRLDLAAPLPEGRALDDVRVRPLAGDFDAQEVNRIYAARGMVAVRPDFLTTPREAFVHLVAEDAVTGDLVGTVTGVDHGAAFGDRRKGASLWCLAVDPNARISGVGEALVRALAAVFAGRGAAAMDLSVLHDNALAIQLYEKLGFVRLPVFTLKRKNPINERLFAGVGTDVEGLNPYARIIVDEAQRRGIDVEVIDAGAGFFRLTYGGRQVRCRESLSELTSAVAMSLCDDKAVTRRLVAAAGVAVPDEIEATGAEAARAMLEKHARIVLKPARGEQGRGISVGLTAQDDLEAAFERAREVCERVLVEEFVAGDDLRLVVIDHRLVAAAIRKAARVYGDGTSTLRTLIERHSRRRAAATGGEASIPLDAETGRAVRAAGLTFDDVVADGREVQVRGTANLHTGGTLHDVTDDVHPALVEAAIRVSRAIDIPVVGVDLMVRTHLEGEYRFIEANERPGLANHEPQPTAERFVDLLFPLSVPAHVRKVRLMAAD